MTIRVDSSSDRTLDTVVRHWADAIARWRFTPATILAMALAVAAAAGVMVPDSGMLLLLGVCGACVAYMSITRPAVGLFVFVVMLYSRASENLTASLGTPSFAPIFAVLMLTMVVAREGIGTLFRPRLGYWVPPVVYGLVLLASVLVAVNQAIAISTVIEYVRELVFVAVVVVYARTIRDTRILTWALIFAGLIPSLLSIYQSITGSTFTFFGFAQYSAQIVVPGELVEVPRPSGHVGDPNFFAMTLIPLIALALHRARYEQRLVFRQFAYLAALIFGVATILTYSRGAYVALAVMFVAAVFAGFVRVRTIVIAAAIGLILFPILPDSYTGRLSSLADIGVAVITSGEGPGITDTDSSVSGRRSEILAGMEMFFDYPILGVGTHNYPEYYQHYARPMGITRSSARTAHSLYVEIAAETGLLGLTAFAFLIGSLGMWLRGVWVSVSQPPELRDLSRAYAVALIGFLTSSIFLHGSYPRFFWMLIAGVIATCVVADERLALRPHFRLEPIRRLSTRVAGSTQHRDRLVGAATAGLVALLVMVSTADAMLSNDGIAIFPRRQEAPGSPVPGRAPVVFATPTVEPPTFRPTVTPRPTSVPVPPTPTISSALPITLRAAMSPAPRDADCDFFDVTQHNVCWPFQAFWADEGGLERFGYPLTDQFEFDGVVIQYFERARLEWDRHASDPQGEVIQSPLGVAALVDAYGVEIMPPDLPLDDPGCLFEDATQQNVCGAFAFYWVSQGSVARLGLPISRQMWEDGVVVQYFEYARLELRTGPDPGSTWITSGRLGAEEIERLLGLP